MNEVVDVDLAIVGGGAAGLSMLAHLGESRWRGTVALVDDGARPEAGRQWAWWSQGELLIDAHAATSASRARVAGDGWVRTLDLAPYSYKAITGGALLDAARLHGSSLPRLVWIEGSAEQVSVLEGDGRERPVGELRVTRPDGSVTLVRAGAVLDSAGVGVGASRRDPRDGPHLDFLGWHVRADRDVFDPDVATVMDFRTDQGDGLAFMYVLPTSTRTALVERTVFVIGRRAADLIDHAEALTLYAERILGIAEQEAVVVEQGAIPLLPPQPAGIGVTPLGAAAGMVKLSTGYAFARIQRHSAAVAQSFASEQRAVPRLTGWRQRLRHRWYGLLDRALLGVIEADPAAARRILEALWRRNDGPAILRFLDEQASLLQQVRLFVTLPFWLFIAAPVVRLRRRRRG
ncbi:lycopene cyclase family protein [Demequina capsici]|uniref:Lycopene cyclase family protein n=1 Tax=Demequina capsici TaxID=3075620 RepID=A0AA96FA71_9MICO|nr:lycopene cyclase family protein [Demequina sp. OYTSA14]WNM25001.1 lycopene cyclase family protein [Demequina sp. OYTSA14]